MNSEKAQLISMYNSEKTKALIQQREHYVKQLFDEAKQKLLAFTTSDRYLIEMKKRLDKYACDEHVRVYVKKEDSRLMEIIKEKLHCEVMMADIEIGGFKIENEHHQIMDETLDTALKDQRAWFEEHSMMILQ